MGSLPKGGGFGKTGQGEQDTCYRELVKSRNQERWGSARDGPGGHCRGEAEPELWRVWALERGERAPGWSSGAAPGAGAGFGWGVSTTGSAWSLAPLPPRSGCRPCKNANSWALPAGGQGLSDFL